MERSRFYRKVLVVDDEPDVLRSVHDLLRIDYEVVTCQQASEALDHLKAATDVAVILSDQRMPGMTGVELLQQARLIRPETTRLLFTAYADIHTVIDAINQGQVFRYITKPWEAAELESVIRQAARHDRREKPASGRAANRQCQADRSQPAQRNLSGSRQPRAEYARDGRARTDGSLETIAGG